LTVTNLILRAGSRKNPHGGLIRVRCHPPILGPEGKGLKPEDSIAHVLRETKRHTKNAGNYSKGVRGGRRSTLWDSRVVDQGEVGERCKETNRKPDAGGGSETSEEG